MHDNRHSLEELRAMDSEQLTQRVKMGDHLEVAREVAHFAHFPRRAPADAAATELQAAGFRVSVERKGLLGAALVARTTSTIEPQIADGFVCHMYSLVESHGGNYNGWDGPVVLREAK